MTWQTLTKNDPIPEKVVEGGYDSDNSPIYIGRASHGGVYFFCQITRHDDVNSASVAHNGMDHKKKSFEILVENGKSYDWIPVHDKEMPKNAVSIGEEGVFIGRCLFENSLRIGIIKTEEGICLVSVDGTEHKIDKYEILVEVSEK